MSENNKSYRIRTKIGVTNNSPMEEKYLTVKLTEKIDSIDIMSLKIKQENAYRFHAADYGVVVGRAIANGGFGVPNVKVSIFIAANVATVNDPIYNAIYPYETVTRKNRDNIRYNLLPDAADDDCYQVVGTFPNKRLVLDDDNYLEIYDTYYKFTTRTNNAGDYMIFGIPTGGQIFHFDADLSDVGILSQKPRDMIYKGFNEKQFENPNQFKTDTNLANLPQIISQDDSVYVYPFWGDEDENIIGITRHDIDINYKFEPTCVFMGSLVTDTNSNHISKKCIPTPGMGLMEEMVTGPGKIEMIRKKQNGDVEQFNVQGTQLINGNGVWCYQIPMNLDYVKTDEYGNIVPSDDPTKGIATRAKVRFRFSMDEFENDSLNSFRTKVLVPNNPKNETYEPDYVFGSFTEEESFRDLLWNNVYTVKSFIPRFQKGNGDINRRFSGVKECNYNGQNNPIPYNNMRINLSFNFIIACLIVKVLIWVAGVYNAFVTALSNAISKFLNAPVIKQIVEIHNKLNGFSKKAWWAFILVAMLRIVMGPLTIVVSAIGTISSLFRRLVSSLSCLYIDGSLCNTLEGAWFFAPNCGKKSTASNDPNNLIWKNMMAKVEGKKMEEIDYSSLKTKTGGGMEDKESIDSTNADDMKDADNQIKIEYIDSEGKPTGSTTAQYVISRGINYFMECVEISLAREYRVIQFDFYNDWINGMVYIPRWERSLKKKRKYFFFGKSRVEVRACNDAYKKRFFERKNYLTEQCGVSYKAKTSDNSIVTPIGCKNTKKFKCHKKYGRRQFKILNDGGVVHEETTSSGLYAYYFRPCEYITDRNPSNNKKVNLFATDIVLLGSLVDCDINGTPSFLTELTSSTYQLPPPLAQTDSSEEGYVYVGRGKKTDILVDETKYLSGVFDMSDAILDPDDDGALTEESGIDWGYTGPGQGVANKTKGYTPGGHFLGISCLNSETSVKSCVNLKRVCEAGVWTSQRQEVFNGYDAERNGNYVDIIPNGLISRDEVSGDNFRKVFATMNHNGLKTKISESGFTVYDFGYMAPENFGGDFSKYTMVNYNESNPTLDKYLAVNGDKNSDGETYEEERPESEVLNLKPIRRSLEDRDRDYMRFRLGIDNETNYLIQSKHLGSDSHGYYMPVYNNSFYFYFGLKPGATALDEFHRQFFAECKHTMTVDDLRLNMELEYYGECCGDKKCRNAFDSPIELSIFKKNAHFNRNTDYLRIYSTSIPIKIVVDSETTYTISDYDDERIINNDGDFSNKVYIDFAVTEGDTTFDFGIGKHTVRVIDSDGRTATKLVEVVRQEITPCPYVSGVEFSKDNYVVNSTEDLISGSIPNRDEFGGWFEFDWSRSVCDGDCVQGHGMFTYEEYDSNCQKTGNKICVKENEVCMLFVSKGHIIRVGDSNWTDDEILSFDEFSNYTDDDIFSGMTSDTYGHCVYAGEEGYYDFYVLYRKDATEKTSPLLIQDNIYVGETPAIDFDIFRTMLDGEEESPVTFRNPIAKVWCKSPNDWYTHLYDDDNRNELTNIQKWYIRKMLYYVVRGVINTNLSPEFNENFTSERDVYVNLYYPVGVGDVKCYIDGNPGNVIRKSSEYAKSSTVAISTHKIKITGSTENPVTTIYAPMKEYGTGVFDIKFFYKPYYYHAVVWEGYTVLPSGNTGSYGHVYGKIYNGVVFDTEEGGIDKQTFGPTMLNDRYNLSDSVSVDRMIDDFNQRRITDIKYDNPDRITFSDDSNLLLITEGSPQEYEESYTPVEYSIETSTVGAPSAWELNFNMVVTGSVRDAKLEFVFENNGYERINWYFPYDVSLSGGSEIMEAVTATTLSGSSIYSGIIGNAKNGSITGSSLQDTTRQIIELVPPREDGSVEKQIKNGALLIESVTRDNLLYSLDSSQQNLGFLSSRNFVRNGIELKYDYNPRYREAKAYVAVSDACLKKNPNNIDKGRALDAFQNGEHGGYTLLSFKVHIPFREQYLQEEIGRKYETVIIDIHSTTGSSRSFDLVNELGYSFEYKNGWLSVKLSDPSPDNANVFDSDSKMWDEFIARMFDKFLEGKNGWTKKTWKNGEKNKFSLNECSITIKSGNIGGAKEDANDIINESTVTFASEITFKVGGDDEDE